jgi:5S rRNA maturation endonuclease (ribonuclease M5)
MTVKQLIQKLKTFDQDKIVILTDPDIEGWEK